MYDFGENALWNESNTEGYVINELRSNLKENLKCWGVNIRVRIELKWNYIEVKFRDFTWNFK